MAPGILPGDYILLNKAVYQIHAPQRGDVVVFVYPDDRRLFFIKRIVALPGDTIEIIDNRVWINDTPLIYQKIARAPAVNFDTQTDTAYLEERNHKQRYPIMASGQDLQDMARLTVPHGHCFVLGDNRNHSRDSRHFGPIPLADVKGRLDYIHWPAQSWSRFGKYNAADQLAKEDI